MRKSVDKGHTPSGACQTLVGSDYTAAEIEYIKGCASYMKAHKILFLAHTDHLRVALLLGYSKLPEQ